MPNVDYPLDPLGEEPDWLPQMMREVRGMVELVADTYQEDRLREGPKR